MLERNKEDKPTVHSTVIYWAPVIYLALQLGVENTEKKDKISWFQGSKNFPVWSAERG